MEYYAAVPSRATRKGTRSRYKNRHPDDNYSFAPIAHLEIRRAGSNGQDDNGSSPAIRTKANSNNSNNKPMGWCSKATILLAINIWTVLMFSRRQMFVLQATLQESATGELEMPHGEVLREMRQHLAQIAIEEQEESGVFTTPVTTMNRVLNKAISTKHQWET